MALEIRHVFTVNGKKMNGIISYNISPMANLLDLTQGTLEQKRPVPDGRVSGIHKKGQMFHPTRKRNPLKIRRVQLTASFVPCAAASFLSFPAAKTNINHP